MFRLTRARTLPLPCDPHVTLQWPDKYPSDVLDYALDPTLWLYDSADTLATCHVSFPEDSGLILLWWGIVEGKAALGLAGGTPGTTLVTLTLTTQAQRSCTARVSLTILNDPTAPASPSIIRLPGAYCVPPSTLSDQGTILTLDDGAPLTL